MPNWVTTGIPIRFGSGENDTGYHPMEIFTTLQPDRGEFDELWYQLYSAISRCNRAIEAINKMETPDAKLLGEVKFLRAHFYYKLQQMWYEVPFITEGMSNADIEACPQSSHDQIMQQIIDDSMPTSTCLRLLPAQPDVLTRWLQLPISPSVT